ncbi:MAG TPA: spermidine synthase [Candidatus Limnocylindria bacterium]|nr:spermidine synthase [Candidatus Limnocylindria bacterium]
MRRLDKALGVLARPATRLLLTSATLLFVELLLIRWIPANVIYVGFFNNFILMASFLGIGCGILLGKRGLRPRPAPFPLLLFALVALVYSGQLNARLPTTNEVWLGTTNRDLVEVNVFVLVPVIVLATAVMATLAMPLGPLLASMRPLRAYAIDITGSLVGIAAFVLLAALRTPPLAWFGVAAALAGLLSLGMGVDRRSIAGAVAMAGVLFLGVVDVRQGDQWSSYYRVTLGENSGAEAVSVNGIPFQTLWPADSTDKEPVYDQLYKWFPGRTYPRMLVIGAGTGTDTAIALKNGVGHVDAVEIDPLMLELGAAKHPNRPYDDPRVVRTVNDGRAFLRTTDAKYDLIVFAQTDSLTLVGTTANLRLESFLFTQEAFESARDHLAPGGMFVLYNWYREDWLVERYERMLANAFGGPPIVRSFPRYGVHMAVLANGPGVAALRGGPPPGDQIDPIDLAQAPVPSTDDWPFPYLRVPAIPDRYLLALFTMFLFALAAIGASVRGVRGSVRLFSPHFFVLGTAFLLLETRSLVTFGLLFGTTWVVNALVFFAILLSVLAAIGLNARFRFRDPRPLYALLLTSLVIGYLLPPASLLFEPAWLRYAVAAVLAFSPVFFANLVFTRSFADTRAADMAFASNLLGAMFGGIVEWSALVVGYQSLLLVVGALYLAAYVLASRWRLLSDAQLVPAATPAD